MSLHAHFGELLVKAVQRGAPGIQGRVFLRRRHTVQLGVDVHARRKDVEARRKVFRGGDGELDALRKVFSRIAVRQIFDRIPCSIYQNVAGVPRRVGVILSSYRAMRDVQSRQQANERRADEAMASQHYDHHATPAAARPER